MHRIARERHTIRLMLATYCRTHHQAQASELCPACHHLLEYALNRLAHCPFQEQKTTCAHCAVHCYTPENRTKIIQVMRYAGPKMLCRHPLLAIWHLMAGLGRRKSAMR